MAERSLLSALLSLGRPVFTTKELAAVLRTSVSSTSQTLGRLAREGVVVRVRRGVWCVPSDPQFSPHALVPLLAGSHPAYVSFFSALRLHGMIEQIPQVIYVATTAHSRTASTAIATFAFHRIAPGFFVDFDWYDRRQTFLVASTEKSVLDCLYVSARRGRRFGRFVDLDLANFDIERAHSLVAKIDDTRLRSYVARRVEELWKRAG